MLSTTLKHSVATLGVVAGLLAAAAPASAEPHVALPPPVEGETTIVDRAACITSQGREGSIECMLRTTEAKPGSEGHVHGCPACPHPALSVAGVGARS